MHPLHIFALFFLIKISNCFVLGVNFNFDATYMQSTVVQGIVTSVNVCALLFVIVAGGYMGFKSGWVGYELPTGYFNILFFISSYMFGLASYYLKLVYFSLIDIFPLELMGCLLVLRQSFLHM